MSTGAPLEVGTPIRYPSVALMCIDSSDAELFDKTTGFRISSRAPGRIFINNQQAVINGYCTRISLTEVNIQWETTNVNVSNNTLTIRAFDGSVPPNVLTTQRITIKPGFYTAPALGKAVATELNGNNILTGFLGQFQVNIGDLNCSDSITNPSNKTVKAKFSTFTIKQTSATNLNFFQILPGTSSVTTGLPALIDDLTNMMGLTPTITAGFGNQIYNEIRGGYSSMQYTPFIDIASSLLTKNQNVRDGTTKKDQNGGGILARIYFSQPTFTAREITITYSPAGNVTASTDNAIGVEPFSRCIEFQMPKQIQWNTTENIDLVDMTILDYLGNPIVYQDIAQEVDVLITPEIVVQLSGTADIQMTFMITEV